MWRVFYFFKKAIQNLLADYGLSLVTIIVIALSLMLVGFFLILVLNASTIVDRFAGHVEIIVFLEDGLSQERIDQLRDKFQSEPSVKQCTFVSKEQALAQFKSEMVGLGDIAAGLDENPLPASLELGLEKEYRDLPNLDQYVETWGAEAGVEEVYYGKEWVERLGRIVRILWIISVIIGLFLVATVIIIVATTLKLAIHRRRDEIEILRLVGATNRFIQAPFFVEGLIQGLLGALISLGLLFVVHILAREWSAGAESLFAPFFPGFSLSFFHIRLLVAFVIGGMLLGLFGSLLSVAKFLKI